MKVRAYLQRIAYSGPVAPNADTLRRLHRAHLLNVPFENLDIAWRRNIRVDQQAFIRKIVEERRGGFCYELNGAFAALLQALGFRVTLLSARVPRADGSEGPEYDHLTLRVDLDEAWLADVGFGDCFVEPLKLVIGIEQEQFGQVFRIIEQQKSLRLEKHEGDWKAQYVFDNKARVLEEFASMCRYHQTSEQSPFTQKRICSRLTPDGRLTLSEMRLIETRDRVRKEQALMSEEEWFAVLEEKFGISRP